ncbi:MAG: hypothetical protein LBL62_12040 [Planctomycetaceae bacterium]|nr:hypothetical protein [Planctomycetaceae bacterium]
MNQINPKFWSLFLLIPYMQSSYDKFNWFELVTSLLVSRFVCWEFLDLVLNLIFACFDFLSVTFSLGVAVMAGLHFALV